MLKVERQEQIMELLKIKGSVLVTELSDHFNCSDETIRRDLKELSNSNLLTRTHGGAFLFEKYDKSYPSEIRKIILHEEKSKMAKEAVKLIEENDFLFLDSSTTCLKLAEWIADEGLSVTILTNSLHIANLCSEKKNDIDVVLLGGRLRKNNFSTVGIEGVSQMDSYFADKSFISPPKISLEHGLTDNNMNEATIRKLMLEKSKERILLMDHTKFQDDGNYLVSNINDVDLIITDIELKSEWNEYLKKNKKLKVKVAGKI